MSWRNRIGERRRARLLKYLGQAVRLWINLKPLKEDLTEIGQDVSQLRRRRSELQTLVDAGEMTAEGMQQELGRISIELLDDIEDVYSEVETIVGTEIVKQDGWGNP